MNGVNRLLFYESVCISYLRKIGRTVNYIFEVFRKALGCTPKPIQASLPKTLRVKIGGVENTGKSCSLSILLQEWSAFPEYYDILLISSLQKRHNESEASFSSRKELQKQLYICVKKLRSGELVRKQDINCITYLLKKLGWQKETPSYMRTILHRWLPTYFPLDTFNRVDPYQFYNTVLSFFSDVPFSSNQIALFSRTSSVSQRQLFEQSSIFKAKHPILCRVSQDREAELCPLETIKLNNRVFTLKMVHVCEKTWRGKHVAVYRRVDKQWIYCSDTYICLTHVLPKKQIYAIVYDSNSQT